MPKITMPAIPPLEGEAPRWATLLKNSIIRAFQNIVQQINASPAISGTLDMGGERISNLGDPANGRDAVNRDYLRRVLEGKEHIIVTGGSGTSISNPITIIATTGNYTHTETLTANTTISPTIPIGIDDLTVVVIQDSTGGWTITWDGALFDTNTLTHIDPQANGVTSFKFVQLSGKWYQVDQQFTNDGGPLAVIGAGSGTNYTIHVRDTGGSPGINFFRSTSTKSASISSGSTAALSVQDSGDTHRFTIFQNGNVQVGSTTDQGFKFYVNGIGKFVATGAAALTVTGSVFASDSIAAIALGVFNNTHGSLGIGVHGEGTLYGGDFQNSGSGAQVVNLISAFGASTTVGIYVGNGSPEGAVTANVGSIYLCGNGGAGTSIYIKESGTGNTGWVGK